MFELDLNLKPLGHIWRLLKGVLVRRRHCRFGPVLTTSPYAIRHDGHDMAAHIVSPVTFSSLVAGRCKGETRLLSVITRGEDNRTCFHPELWHFGTNCNCFSAAAPARPASVTQNSTQQPRMTSLQRCGTFKYTVPARSRMFGWCRHYRNTHQIRETRSNRIE